MSDLTPFYGTGTLLTDDIFQLSAEPGVSAGVAAGEPVPPHPAGGDPPPPPRHRVHTRPRHQAFITLYHSPALVLRIQ
jgi:hypothetical protein